MLKVLLTSIGGELSPLIGKSLKESKKINIKIIGTDAKYQNINKNFFDGFYKVSKTGNKFLKQIS